MPSVDLLKMLKENNKNPELVERLEAAVNQMHAKLEEAGVDPSNKEQLTEYIKNSILRQSSK